MQEVKVEMRQNVMMRRSVAPSMQKQTLKPIMYAISIFVVFLMLVGCSNADPVQDDLINYWNNEVLPLDAEETEIIEAYESVTGDNYKNDEDLLKVLKEITPQYKLLSEKIESIQPATAEVKALHELYISASNKQYNAFLQFAAAIEKEDANLVVEANEKLDEARASLRDYDNQIAELQKEHEIE